MAGVSRCAGIVLAGGRSRRMGRPKASLEWEGSTLAARVAGVLHAALDGPIVVVGAPGQALPPLPPRTEIARDAREGRGPLEGLAAGLRTVGDRASSAFVAAVDLPFLSPDAVHLIVSALEAGAEAAVPFAQGRPHPLAAAYCTSVVDPVEQLLGQDRLQMLDLLGRLRVRWVEEAELRRVDPRLASLSNLNTAEEYAAATRGARCAPDASTR
jgi:molybdopterin-guanine dinucleotide biosynthesis protein A